MARYSAFLGRKVEVHYRAGDILLPASGTFVADSGRSIFLEQHLEQHGQMKQFRWEIPYQYIVRLEERNETDTGADADAAKLSSPTPPFGVRSRQPQREPQRDANARDSLKKSDVSGSDPILPLRNRPKPA
jgi:hypothetical protein